MIPFRSHDLDADTTNRDIMQLIVSVLVCSRSRSQTGHATIESLTHGSSICDSTIVMGRYHCILNGLTLIIEYLAPDMRPYAKHNVF